MRRRDNLTREVILNCSNEYNFSAPQEAQNLREKKARGGLAIGAGDAGNFEFLGRVSVEIGADRGQCPAAVSDTSPCHTWACRLRRRIGNNPHRAGLDGAVNVAVAIGSLAFHGDKYIARFDATGIMLYTGDGRCKKRRLPVAGEDFDALEQIMEVHCLRPNLTCTGMHFFYTPLPLQCQESPRSNLPGT